MKNKEQNQRTLALADMALSRIKSLGLPAEPHVFETWYNYATGHNPALRGLINSILEEKGALTATDIDEICSRFGSVRTSDRTREAGAKATAELHEVTAGLETALESATRYSATLDKATELLGQTEDKDKLRAVVESTLVKTHQIQIANRMLQSRLSSSRHEITELQTNLETLRTESLTDSLTGLANRKCFDESLNRLLCEKPPASVHASLLMIDVDHFKAINDRHGHPVGDQVLRLIGQSISQSLKQRCTAFRYGGEEFAVILPETAERQAIKIADQIRADVTAKELVKRSTGERIGRMTVSIGVAYQQPGDTVESLIELADAGLYEAKRTGRNKVCRSKQRDADRLQWIGSGFPNSGPLERAIKCERL